MPSQPPGTPPASIDDLLVDPHQALADRRDAPYRLIFNRAGIGMARLSLSGSILEANQRFADIVGRQPADLLGLHADDITHPQDQADIVHAARAFFRLYGDVFRDLPLPAPLPVPATQALDGAMA